MNNPAAKPATYVYIDGFNFYYGVFKNRPEWKWLNIQLFCERLLPDHDVKIIKYFSAIVDEGRANSQKRERQMLYWQALKTLPKLQIIKGKFQLKQVNCEAKCSEPYFINREKKTDVNIAVHMVGDCAENLCDALVLISGDSDLEPAAAWVHQRKPIRIYVPRLPDDVSERAYNFYKSIKADYRVMPTDRISASLFSSGVKVADKKWVTRPEEWAATDPAARV